MSIHNLEESAAQAAQEAPRSAVFNCTVCNRSTPVSEPHVCKLDARQRRRIEAWKRLTRLQARRDAAPRPCDDCGVLVGRREVHACRGRVDNLAAATEAANVAGVVGLLRRHGYKVEKQEP